MAQQYDSINNRHRDFIAQQKIFFVATAMAEGKINLSPKGMDTFKLVDANTVRWLNLTGSGNETAAHLLANGRITIMFCAFEGSPMILRLYGQARSIHSRDDEWSSLIRQFPDLPGARQIIDIKIDLVQTSCGMGVPLYQYESDRDLLNQWAEKKQPEGIQDYWLEKNQYSLDGKPTGISN